MEYGMIVESTQTGYSAYFPDLPGLAVTGRNLPELRERAAQALALHLHGLEESGEPIPCPTQAAGETRVAPAPMNPVSLAVERAIRESGMSEYALAKALGVHQRVLTRLTDLFYWGHSLSSLRRVAEVLGREVVLEFRRAS